MQWYTSASYSAHTRGKDSDSRGSKLRTHGEKKRHQNGKWQARTIPNRYYATSTLLNCSWTETKCSMTAEKRWKIKIIVYKHRITIPCVHTEWVNWWLYWRIRRRAVYVHICKVKIGALVGKPNSATTMCAHKHKWNWLKCEKCKNVVQPQREYIHTHTFGRGCG